MPLKLKTLLSMLVRTLREGFKKWAAKAGGVLLGSKSYPLLGIPSGLETQVRAVEVLYPSEQVSGFDPVWQKNSDVVIPASGVLILEGAIATRLGGNLIKNGKLVTTYLQSLDGKRPEQHDLFRFSTKRFFPKIYKTEEPVISLAAGWQGSFYHWFYDVLVRFHLIEQSGLHSTKIFIESLHPFQRESLALLDVEKHVINAAEYDAVSSPRLFIPSIVQVPTAWGCRFLREKFLSKLERTKKRRIYISRADAVRRRIQNENEVIALLQKYGFEKVSLSSLSLKQQMEVFYNAEMIVGPHGAGYSHLVFCDPGTPVIELFAPDYVNNCYWHLSRWAGLSYTVLFGENYGSENPKDPDIIVDVDRLNSKVIAEIS